jgi:hypothetical protein
MHGAAQEFDGWVVLSSCQETCYKPRSADQEVLSSNQCKYDALELLMSAHFCQALREFPKCILWRSRYIHEYPSYKRGGILHLLLKSGE